MYAKACVHCQEQFETPYKSTKYCTEFCRENSKRMAYVERWANGKHHDPKKTGFKKYPLKHLSKQEYEP